MKQTNRKSWQWVNTVFLVIWLRGWWGDIAVCNVLSVDWRTAAPQWLTCWLLRWEVCTTLGRRLCMCREECCFFCLGYQHSSNKETPFWVFSLPTYPTPNAHKHSTHRHTAQWTKIEWLTHVQCAFNTKCIVYVHKNPTVELLKHWVYDRFGKI